MLSGDTAQARVELAAVDSMLIAAAKLDPRWPDPLNMRATVAYFIARRGGEFEVRRAAIDSGLLWAEESLKRSANNPDGLEARGNLAYFKAIAGFETDVQKIEAGVEAARKDLEQATKLNPQQAGAWATLSHLYTRVATNLEVLGAAEKALSADAFLAQADQVLNRIFLTAYDLESFDLKAQPYCDQLVKRFPGSFNAYRCQLMLMTIPKPRVVDPNRAWQLADSAYAKAPASIREVQHLNNRMFVAAVLAKAGLTDSARAVAERARGDGTVDPTREALLRGSYVYVLLGDTTAAVNALRTYLAANDGRRDSFRTDPGWWLRPIAGTSQYKAVVGTP